MARTLTPIVLSLVLFAGLLELGLRFAFPLPEVTGFDRARYSPLQPGATGEAPSGLGHASFTWASDPDGYAFDHRLNLYGFRDAEWSLQPRAAARVAFIGDSFVEGFGAEAGDTLPAVFAEVASDAKLAVETLNLGVGGAGLSRYAWLLRDALPLFRPDGVILVLYANDLLPEPWDPAWLAEAPSFERTRWWEPRVLYVLRERAAGRRVPRRWLEAPFLYLPAEPDPRNPWSHERASARLSRSVSPEIARAMRGGRFNPALANWFGWAGGALATPVDWTAHLGALDAYAAEHEARLFVVYVPSKSQVTDRYLEFQAEYSTGSRSLRDAGFQVHAQWLARSSEAQDIPFLDLTPLLRGAESEGPELYWRYDDHLRPRGYRQVGRWIAEWWLAER